MTVSHMDRPEDFFGDYEYHMADWSKKVLEYWVEHPEHRITWAEVYHLALYTAWETRNYEWVDDILDGPDPMNDLIAQSAGHSEWSHKLDCMGEHK